MSKHDHDPCCPSTGMAMPFGYVPVMPCQCSFISYIRADERERHGNNCGGMWDEWTHDLRAKVEALRDEAMDHSRTTGDQSFAGSIVAYTTVLALFDGGSDD